MLSGDAIGRLTVLYDEDCAFCVLCARLLARLDRSRSLRLVALQRADEVIADVPSRAELLAALHVVEDRGQWERGGAACLRIADALPGLRWLSAVGRLQLVRRWVEPAYDLIARNRQRLGGLLGPSDCPYEGVGG